MIYSKEQLIERSRLDYLDVSRYLESIYQRTPSLQYLLFNFSEAPDILRLFTTFNGGDEDFILVGKRDEFTTGFPHWFNYRYDTEETDVYEVGEFRIYVGTHG